MSEEQEISHRDEFVEVIAQTFAPWLFELFGTEPEEMGFPIYDTKEEVEEHLARQFSPVEYWMDQGRKLGEAVHAMLTAVGVDVDAIDIQALIEAGLIQRVALAGSLHDPQEDAA